MICNERDGITLHKSYMNGEWPDGTYVKKDSHSLTLSSITWGQGGLNPKSLPKII